MNINKALLLFTVMFGGFASNSFGQIFFADFSNSTYDTTINGVPNYNQDLNLQLLYGNSVTSLSSTPVVTLLLNSQNTSPSGNQLGQTLSAAGDISFMEGLIYDNSGMGYLFDSSYLGQNVYLEVLAWTGNYSSYQAALNSGDPSAAVGTSSVFTSKVPGSPSIPFYADVSNVGVINLVSDSGLRANTVVPEPSSLVMAGVGIGSMLIFRRRRKS